jgi:PemK-like, MazF-like toxin of type II toxin-antitoxin system
MERTPNITSASQKKKALTYKKWDVVFIRKFPHQEDDKKHSPKPAIVLGVLANKLRVCPITSKVHQASNYNDTILIEENSEEFKKMNLDKESIIVLDRIEEIELPNISPPFGTCHSTTVQLIKEFLSR